MSTKERMIIKTPHKHAAPIHAWADGAEIEMEPMYVAQEWYCCPYPTWDINCAYRIKPAVKADIERVLEATKDGRVWHSTPISGNTKLTFDGETGKLKAAEILKCGS